MEKLKTHGGAGLKLFLEENLGQFDERVASEIRPALKRCTTMPNNNSGDSQSIEKLQIAINADKEKITAEANLRTSQQAFDELKQEAQEKYGTSHLEELRRKLNEMKKENEEKRTDYQRHLDEIEKKLQEVEQQDGEAARRPRMRPLSNTDQLYVLGPPDRLRYRLVQLETKSRSRPGLRDAKTVELEKVAAFRDITEAVDKALDSLSEQLFGQIVRVLERELSRALEEVPTNQSC